MGSSFAAGPGLRPRTQDSPRGAGRSSVNYAHLAAEKLGLDLTDVSHSGATTSDLLEGGARPAQVRVGALPSGWHRGYRCWLCGATTMEPRHDDSWFGQGGADG